MASFIRADQDQLLHLLEGQLNVLNRRQAHAAGVTRHALHHRLRVGGQWRRLLPGVYLAEAGTPSPLQQEIAALLYAGPGSMITGLAALRHYSIRGPVAESIEVLVPASRRRCDTAFVRLRRTIRMPERFSRAGPVRYAPSSRAVADAVRGLDTLREVRAVVADAVQHGTCRLQDLANELASGPNIGSALFREALTDVLGGIRSAAEGDLKNILVRSGLPMPLFNAEVYDGDEFVASPDGWWPDLGVAVEVDSVEWHLSPEDHARTLARGRRMARYQMNVLRFTPKQLRADPAQVVADIRAALEGARGRPPLNLRTVPAAAPGATLGRLRGPSVSAAPNGPAGRC